jgi:signal transduction histidine kinase
MDELVRAAEALGRGELAARVDLHRARHGEARILGVTFNEMADRIEAQLRDQRALLALVSHEIRTPLARMRLLAERVDHPDGATRAAAAAAMDQEVAELDALVSDLLANSRIDFSAAQHIALSPIEVATRAVEAARLDPTVLEVEGKPQAFPGDATLVVRAVVNLLENAKKHGGAGLALHVEERDGFVAFQVDDDGPGLGPGEDARVFEPFYRGAAADVERPDAHAARSVGLGLSLVKRIALAHGGWVSAGSRDAGVAGARFIIAFPCAAA